MTNLLGKWGVYAYENKKIQGEIVALISTSDYPYFLLRQDDGTLAKAYIGYLTVYDHRVGDGSPYR